MIQASPEARGSRGKVRGLREGHVDLRVAGGIRYDAGVDGGDVGSGLAVGFPWSHLTLNRQDRERPR